MNVNSLQPKRKESHVVWPIKATLRKVERWSCYVPVASGRYEIYAGVNTSVVIELETTLDLHLLLEVHLILLVHIVNNDFGTKQERKKQSKLTGIARRKPATVP